MKERVQTSEKSKLVTYRTDMNPEQTVHPIYIDHTVPEYERLVVTRLRLFSHNLAIEKGRWSRQPKEQRLCQCGQVQTENHLLSECPNTAHVRNTHPGINYTLPLLFDENPSVIANVCHSIAKDFM